MPKDLLNAVGSFGEGFIKTLQSERERKQKELEFNQEMSFRTRQQNLMSIYQQKQMENWDVDNQLAQDKAGVDIRSGYNEMPMMPNAPLFPVLQGGVGGGEKNKDFGLLKPFQEDKFYAPKQEEMKGIERTITDYTDPNNPLIFGITDDGRRIPLGKGKVDKGNVTNINLKQPTEPYTDTTKLDTAWTEYSQYDDLTKNYNPDEKPKDKDGKEISFDALQKAKDVKMKELESLTNDRAKKISEEYVGFNSMFNDILRDPKFKSAPDKNTYISRIMNGYPDEAIRQMKDLIAKRIF